MNLITRIEELIDQFHADVKAKFDGLGSGGGGSSRPRHILQFHQRLRIEADRRWIVLGDTNYGFSDQELSEGVGVGGEPIVEWEHQGLELLKGETLDVLRMRIRLSNSNADITDAKLRIIFMHPDSVSQNLSGVDADGETTEITVFSTDSLATHTFEAGVMSGQVNDQHRVTLPLNFTAPEHGQVVAYWQAVGTNTTRRYAYPNFRWEWLGAV